MQTVLTPEDHLLLLLGRGTVSAQVQDQALTVLATSVRWERLLEQAKAHGVYPLFSRNLGRLGCSSVPPHIQAELKRLTQLNAFRSLRFAAELTDILQVLANAGIPALPLKGVALAQSLYGDVTLRDCSDIDVLIPRQAVAQALVVLQPEHERKGKKTGVTAAEIESLMASKKGYDLVSQRRGLPCPLDLHWHVAWNQYRDDGAIDDLWAEARRHNFRGQEAWTLSPEWELLYLAVHAARHCWQSVKSLVDIHEVCIGRDLNWERVWDKARRFGWEEVVRLTLGICHTRLATPCPPGFSFQDLPRWVKVFPDASLFPPYWQNGLLLLYLLTHPAEQLRYLARVVFIPTRTERRLVPLPSALGFLYYLLRPVRLACLGSWWFVRVGYRAWRVDKR